MDRQRVQEPLTDIASVLVPAEELAKQTNGVLVIAYCYPPENETGAQRPYRFVKYLGRYGYQPEVITNSIAETDQSFENIHGATTLNRPGASRAVDRLLRLSQRVLPYNDRLPWTSAAIAVTQRVVYSRPISAVISTSPPVCAHLVAGWIKHQLKIPWIADLRDPIRGNPFRTARLGKPYDAVLEHMIVRYADFVIANTDAAAEMLKRRYPRMSHKIRLIWNGFDPEEQIAPLPIPARAHKVLLHAGTIYGARHPGMLLESLKRLTSSGSLPPGELRVRLVGDLELHPAWCESSNFSALLSEGWVECVNRVIPLEDARREMAQADYLLLLDLNELGTGLQVPAKLFEYIRIGRPILAFTTEDSAVSRILANAGIPYVCVYTKDSKNEVDQKVIEFLSKPTEAAAPSEWFQRTFNATAQTALLAEMLTPLLKSAR